MPSLIRNITDKKGNSPLNFIIDYGFFDFAKILIRDPRCDINHYNSEGVSPLCFAIKLKNIEIVQELIKSKAFVNLPNKDTQTPLFLAVKIHWLKIIKLLLKNGANPNLWLTNKQSVLDISSQDVEEILIHYGAKENTRHLIK